MKALLGRLRTLRESAGLTPEAVDERLILGPGWISRFESGEIVPTIDQLLAILDVLEANPAGLFADVATMGQSGHIERHLDAEEDGADLLLKFRYANHDAVYRLPNATSAQFSEILKELRNGLATLADPTSAYGGAIKTDAVAKTFLRAVATWPHLNPSDLWWFLVSRAFCDPFNHPASFARLDFGQSWKRTSGWALEEVMVRHYGPFLKSRGVDLLIPAGELKRALVGQLVCSHRVEPDKVDVVVAGTSAGVAVCYGVVHVKASFAERRTDDVPLSEALVKAGFTSPLWTMDCKGVPSAMPTNPGELGPHRDSGDDRRSAKRKDIEDDGSFSACFSYNQNTVPTPLGQSAKSRISVCDFSNPDDAFSRFLIGEWTRFAEARRES